MTLTLSIILTSLPLLSWYFQYKSSKRQNLLHEFKNHWTCYKGDWIFLIINSIFLYAVVVTPIIFLVIAVSILANTGMHFFWSRNNIGQTGHLFGKKTKKLNFAGWTHLIFSSIETAIIFWILIGISQNISLHIIGLITVSVFGLLIIYGSKKSNSSFIKSDSIAGTALTIAALSSLVLRLQM
ncbi:hypothetical protein HOD30_01275 [Candidatus Peregrinibacteria bacterium]|jgi:hypothetical protein|nr:hypothetical protein [Candidatus Peregrinibacteria bacterium]MBT4632266.1 hypothetical protein [Candidatus Peregrinibacteria bacterium]